MGKGSFFKHFTGLHGFQFSELLMALTLPGSNVVFNFRDMGDDYIVIHDLFILPLGGDLNLTQVVCYILVNILHHAS